MPKENVCQFPGPMRPDSIALLTAIEDTIDDLAVGKVTYFEILGVLDVVGKRLYEKHLSLYELPEE
jgi:hypothetical protein